MRQKSDLEALVRRTEEQLAYFSEAAGVGCFSVSENRELREEPCRLCRTVSGISGKQINCNEQLLYSAYQSERFDGRYVFYCPMGLVHFASPIFSEGHIFAAAVGGPVLLADEEEFISEDIIKKYGINESYTEELKQALSDIPQVRPGRVTALSQLLYTVCSGLSGTEQLKYLSDEESLGNDMEKYLSLISTMGGKSAEGAYPIEKERELLSLISLADKERSQELLDDILYHIISYSNREFEKAKARILELVVLLSRAAVEGGADLNEIFGLNYKFLAQMNTYKTVEELSNWLFNIMTRFTDCVFNKIDIKHKGTIAKAIEFIKHNYSRKITLDEVAGNVFLSPSYFSKVFGEEMGVSFNNYLSQIRIENAKRLLLSEEMDINGISEICGFEDQSYFSKVFKKITGVSPGKYRQRHGK